MPAHDVRDFRESLERFISARDYHGRRWLDARWGVYAFYDYDGEPIYVGQTNERLRTRIRRHLTNQRTDAVAMRILDVFEVAAVEVWPIWDLETIPGSNSEAKVRLNSYEYSAYLSAIEKSRFNAILNEKIPPVSPRVDMPESLRWELIDARTRAERGHPDIRLARRAETISRLAAVARERGEVTEGLRRVIVVQAVRLAYIAATRLAEAEGRVAPRADAIDIAALVGNVLFESRSQAAGDASEEEAD
ncbi:GIY-YIG nuclease family protein [Clavibacter michiganensis]|uniref:GIY-YIG nuclease family protein n=1 Tax=Clavibacter michiganensis TaxID=28447 RepID=UPI0013664DEE|nr:GIY-YIG nuclease family protein [Clavibacter michiganensis]MWJ12819.1 GIY-YIG nuclease family protein [Clavibacter michiganensis subsp. michiganensis]MWJ46910.1 GIY-YIG nuclease family protein [Clavibacter michiganensis subsp. michiganensis]